MREKELEKIKEYKYGFSTDIENIRAPKGLNKEVIKFISNIKKEPQWMLDWRLKAYERLQQLKEPDWQKPKFPKIDYQDLYYYSAPKSAKDKPKSLDEVDPKLLETYAKLGIPLKEQEKLSGVAVDAVFDSVSVATTFKDKLNEKGIIFCPISEAIQKYPDLVKIVTQITHIGNTSFGIGHELFSNTNEEKVVALGSSVVVMIDYLSGEKVPIDKQSREKLYPYLKKN